LALKPQLIAIASSHLLFRNQ